MKKNFTTAPFGILLPLTLAMILGVPAGNSADVTPTSHTPSVKTKSATVTTETGIASYNGSKYHGNPTASGEIFNMNELTAAHPKLAFGTRVKVTHLESQRSVVVRINDRGPFVPGRIIDLSQAAAADCWRCSCYQPSGVRQIEGRKLNVKARLPLRKFSGTLRPNDIVKTTLFLCLLLVSSARSGAEIKPLSKLDKAELTARLQTDARSVQVHRDGLQTVIRYLDSRPDLFPATRLNESRLLRREEKLEVWNAWQRFLDYMVGLDSIERYHASFHRLKGAAREDSFLIGYTALLAQYRAALEFIDRAERNPEWDKVLNDPVPELGLPGGMYAKLKFRFLNVAIASEYAARAVVMKTFPDNQLPDLRAAIRDDAQYVWKAGKGRGEVLTAKNALKVIQNGANSAWLPIQAGVSEWMGDTKVYRTGRSLISPAQVEQLKKLLQPGDVLLERREWYVSNVGLPGFWSHAALYIGTAEDRRPFFADTDTQTWVKQQGEPSGDVELLLQKRSATGYEQSQKPEHGQAVRIIEAISEGVSLTTMEHTADCDSLAVLRPRLSKAERAQALTRAFHYVGRPYDFNFDFATDAELVCTELVYKSYEPANGFTGLKFPLTEMLGRKLLPANEIARQFDSQQGTPQQQFDLVIFLDGQERRRNAVEGTLTGFRSSWQRPKWHVLVQSQK